MDLMPPRGPELASRQVEDDLRRRCRVGEWKAGERLPAVADLAQHYGVARNTVTKALRRLADDGLVEIVPSWAHSAPAANPSCRTGTMRVLSAS
jgi:DNA-binding GntR family transcriptional regulator